jgi:hypothetical protein
MATFSDWLHAESFHLKNEGHSYNVNDKDKKAVRFKTGSVSSRSSESSDVSHFPPPPFDSTQILSDSKYPPYNSKLGSLV